MGQDTEIYVKTRDGQPPQTEVGLKFLRFESREQYQEQYDLLLWPTGATHRADIAANWRYVPGWIKWPETAEALMLLLTAPNVEVVWYFGDYTPPEEVNNPENVCTLDRMREYTAEYMAELGADPMRPLREKWAVLLGIPEFPDVRWVK